MTNVSAPRTMPVQPTLPPGYAARPRIVPAEQASGRITQIGSYQTEGAYMPGVPYSPATEMSGSLEPPRASHVRILPTSLPYVHEQIMAQREAKAQAKREAAAQEAAQAQAERQRQEQEQAGYGGEEDEEFGAPLARERSLEQQAASARALKPHQRSLVDLHKLRLDPPPEGTAEGVPTKTKPRKRRWQFGIRSRNQPYEAMLFLYKAIKAQGGVWAIEPIEPEPTPQEPPQSEPETDTDTEGLKTLTMKKEKERRDGGSHRHHHRHRPSGTTTSDGRPRRQGNADEDNNGKKDYDTGPVKGKNPTFHSTL
ncbi:Protein kinase, partial [Ascosphaera atra]